MLTNLIEAVSYKIHTVLTDNGIPFTHKPSTATYSMHGFDRVCRDNGIEHRLARPNHLPRRSADRRPGGHGSTACCRWTNGQIERMNRTIKDATVRTFRYSSADQLRRHLHAFLPADNCARRLKTPHEFICHQWAVEPERFKVDPHHHNPGLST